MKIVKQRKDPSKQNRLTELLEELQDFVAVSAEQGMAAHEAELIIWRQVLNLGHQALQTFFDRVGSGDLGETVEVEGDRRLRRLPGLYSRSYCSVFGSFELQRTVYGTRVGQRIELVPFDQRLCLPES